MTTETFDNPADFLAALKGAPRQKRGRGARPDIPSAGRATSAGLTPLLIAGWSSSYVVGRGYRMTRGDLDTGYCASELEMCQKAKVAR